ncbi:MAG: hypothetical protein KAQ89_02565, partial [Planctomycetes bacterium]|nr:hypothetical protein [Planctomycetota bacterium]
LVEKTKDLARKIAEVKSKVTSKIKTPLAKPPIETVASPSPQMPNRFAQAGQVEELVSASVGDDSDGEFLSEAKTMQQFNSQFGHFQDDAPACDICGSITVRNGTCYKCFNCGNSMGCS